MPISVFSSRSSPTLLPSKYPPIPPGQPPIIAPRPPPSSPPQIPSPTTLSFIFFLPKNFCCFALIPPFLSLLPPLSLAAFFIGSFLLPSLSRSRKSGFAFLASRTSSLIFVSMTSFINFNLWNSSLSRAELNPDFLIASILFSISLEDRTSC